MSTRIDHGYRLAEGTDFFTFEAKLRAVMNPIRDRIDARWLMRKAMFGIDTADLHSKERETNPLLAAQFTFDEEQAKEAARGYVQATSSRFFDPHQFSVSFGRDPLTGRIMALVYTENAEFFTAWNELPEVEPYAYQNYTDAPDDVTDAEWEERREAWERMMPNCAPAICSMVTFTLRSTLYDTGMMKLSRPRGTTDEHEARISLLHDTAPTFDARVHNVATSALAWAWREQHLIEDDRDSMYAWLAAVREQQNSPDPGVLHAARATIVDHNLMLNHILRNEPLPHVDLSAVAEAAAKAVAEQGPRP